MSEKQGQGMSQRLQDVREALDVLLVGHKGNLEGLKHIRRAYLLLDGMERSAPEDVNSQRLSILEGLIQRLKADVPPEKSPLDKEALALFEQIQHWKSLNNSEIVIEQTSLDLTPGGHPGKPTSSYEPGSALKSHITGHNSLLDYQPGTIRTTDGRPISLLSVFGDIINLVPGVTRLGIPVNKQFEFLSMSSKMALTSVAMAIAEQEYATAIEWAEQARALVWQNLYSPRLTREEIQNRQITRSEEVPQRLDQSQEARMNSNQSQSTERIKNEMKSATGLDRLLREPSRDQSLGMGPKSLEELAPAVRDGPVIFINISEYRCDALALLSDDQGTALVVPIPLRQVTLQSAEQLSQKLVELLRTIGVGARNVRKHMRRGEIRDKNEAFKSILQTLWLDYVEPIINELAYQVNLESPPRLWWCTSGPLAFLPLHAAGLYDIKEPGHKLSDYVVSSYTPNITALLNQPRPTTHEELKILTVAISDTPGAPLPSTEEEVEIIHRLAANFPAVSLTNEEATKRQVLEELAESNWVHLACHGKQVGGTPMSSAFILHDDELKLSEIIQTRLPNAEFAFLSACETAVGDGGVPEESAHLAAGMLFTGYRGVVATMWSIQDEIAPRVTENFYRYMFRNGKPDSEDAAYALHKAVNSLQESEVSFASWVPFIHIGR